MRTGDEAAGAVRLRKATDSTAAIVDELIKAAVASGTVSDQRMVSIARTQFQLGFMALRRALDNDAGSM